MKMSGTAPLLTDDAGARYAGLKHPNGSESTLVFKGEDSPPVGAAAEIAYVQWDVKLEDTDIALTAVPATVVAGSVFRIDSEYMVVNDVANPDNPGVVRGQYYTSASTHAAGASVSIWAPESEAGGTQGPPGPPGPAGPPGSPGEPASTQGVTDGSEAAAGAIGEYLVMSNTAGVTLPSATPTRVSSLGLSAGDWEVWGAIDFQPAAGVSPNMVAASISIHPDALPTDDDLMTGVGILNMITTSALTTGQRQMLMTGQCRSNSASPLDLYLVGQTTLGGSGLLTAKGYICARRVR